MTIDDPDLRADRETAHALVSQARAVVIYTDLLRQALEGEDLDRERLDRLVAEVGGAAEQLAERVNHLAEESCKVSAVG